MSDAEYLGESPQESGEAPQWYKSVVAVILLILVAILFLLNPRNSEPATEPASPVSENPGTFDYIS